MDEKEQELRELLENLGKLVPTLLVIGMTADKHGALLMGSPEEDDEKRRVDLCAAIAMMMEQKQELREVVFSAVSWFMQRTLSTATECASHSNNWKSSMNPRIEIELKHRRCSKARRAAMCLAPCKHAVGVRRLV